MNRQWMHLKGGDAIQAYAHMYSTHQAKVSIKYLDLWCMWNTPGGLLVLEAEQQLATTSSDTLQSAPHTKQCKLVLVTPL